MFLEADYRGVHLSSEHRVLDTDKVLLLRPPQVSAARKAKALRDYLSAIGMPFDFHFDLETPQSTFCTELVRAVMPELHLPVSTLYGIKMVMPEAIAAEAAQGKAPLRFVSYARATRGGWERAGREELRADIIAAWQRR